MGDPATPTPAERADTRELAQRIVDSVRNDEAMPYSMTQARTGIEPWQAYEMRPTTRRSIESLVLRLAQEIALLVEERGAERGCQGTIRVAPSNAQCLACGLYGQRCDRTGPKRW